MTGETKSVQFSGFKLDFKVVEISGFNCTNARMEARRKYPKWYGLREKMIAENKYKFLLVRKIGRKKCTPK